MFVMNGYTWDIAFVRPYSPELRRSDGSITVGMTDWNKRTVFISKALRGQFLRKVFIHEICHVACFSFDVKMDIEQEEFLCDFVSTYGDEIFEVVDDFFAVLKKYA